MVFLLQSAQNRIIVLLIAAAVDLMVGDPHWMWHPVQGVGTLITFLEKHLRRLFAVPPPEERKIHFPDAAAGGSKNSLSEEGANQLPNGSGEEIKSLSSEESEHHRSGNAKKGSPALLHRERNREEAWGLHTRELAAGGLLVFLILAAAAGVISFLWILCGRLHPSWRLAAEGILCGRLLALRSLGEAGFSVRDPLLRGDVEGARRAVSMIVGRDTDRLDAEGIARAAVETVAENTSDGVTAPLFYMILFGGMGGMLYKAVNTMDSMIGYKNPRYLYFGRAAARLDDVLNLLPARLTALLMVAACLLPGKTEVSLSHPSGRKVLIPDAAAAFRIWRRDRQKSPSPNSSQTESVCAGALHLRLLGDTWYFGELHHKPAIGDGGRLVVPEDITRAVGLMRRTSFLMYAAGLCLLLGIYHLK